MSPPLDPALERQLAAAFVAELILCRRIIQSYPESHPSVGAGLERAVGRLKPLVASGKPFTIGITREGVMLNRDYLEKTNTRFAAYAELLASFGIIAATFDAALRPDDLLSFNRIVTTPRREIWETGGIIPALSKAGIHAIKVQAINPSVFILTDEVSPAGADTQTDQWEVFVRKLLQGYFAISRQQLLQLLAAPPSDLAREFDTILAGFPDEARSESLKVMATYIAGLGNRHQSEAPEGTLDNIYAFIAGLSPSMRTDFIRNICRSATTAPHFSERLLQRLPSPELQQVTESFALHGEEMPEMLLALMQRLSHHADSTPALDAAVSDPALGEKARVLFSKGDFDIYVPPDYRDTLMAVLETGCLPDAESLALDGLRDTLDAGHLERKVADIITEIMKVIPLEEQGNGIRRNLLDLTTYFLDNGDFDALARICDILLSGEREASERKFIDPGFIQKVLDAPALLGRECYPGIRSIVRSVGRPFVIPLIDRLSNEENLSLRRFWYDCLNELGDMVRHAALERLNDDRWYVVRNLLILLRSYNDDEVKLQVRRLAGSPHIRIRSEAFKSLLHYQDTNADRLLLQELASPDPDRKLAAVQNAELSRNPVVVDRLLGILDNDSFKEGALAIKIAAVQSLANGDNARALPAFTRILRSSSLFNFARLNQLKIEIIRVLPRFPVDVVRPLLKELAASRWKAISSAAAEALKYLQGGAP